MHVYGNSPHSLDGIGMEEDSPRFCQRRRFLNRLYGAYFVIGEHNGDEDNVIIDRIGKNSHVQAALAVHRKIGYRKSVFLQVPA